MLTLQAVSADSKDCVKFLRKVIRDNESARYGEGWRVRANAATGWKVRFERTVRGETGEPDREVEVQTDFAVTLPGKTGMIQSFTDSKPVMVCSPRQVWVDGSDASIVAKLLADGSRLSITATSGSTHSSQHGLSFYMLEATFPGVPYGEIQIGHTTTAKDGETLVSGAICIR